MPVLPNKWRVQVQNQSLKNLTIETDITGKVSIVLNERDITVSEIQNLVQMVRTMDQIGYKTITFSII